LEVHGHVDLARRVEITGQGFPIRQIQAVHDEAKGGIARIRGGDAP